MPPDRFDSSAAATLERLQQLNSTPLKQVSAAVSTTHAARQFFAPDSVEQLTALLDRYPQARLLAGGTDLALEVTQRLRPVEVLIYLGRIAALRAVEQQEGALVVGAAVSLTDLYHHLVKRYPDCYELLERFGSPQIRTINPHQQRRFA